MNDLISRQKMKNMITNHWSDFSNAANYRTALACVDAVPTVTPAQPQRMRAKWIATTSLQEGQITWIDYKCSNCSHHRSKPMNYCEVCGAKMER